ncbi:YopX family protein [Clostridium paraputrificum]|uniref:YopX family protein n=1 Tax=Clostridium paraputrificum TaxID=29363 RepID=UPI0018981103|nr:YopX family protein [Clostridium paraputrificum]MDB2125783.1 YopX family protein [Clostridium paraputrificum]
MSKVKFKIWDKTHNKWLTSNCGGFLLTQEGNAIFHQNGDNPLEALIEQIDYEALLYTGIKDKNGEEICQGDIVSIFFGTQLSEVKWNRKYGCWEIKVEFTIHNEGWDLLGNHNEQCVVIGNIYENPELLEGDSQ